MTSAVSALVTGASTGLGRELAGLFAADGIDLVVVSSERSSTQLAGVATVSGHFVTRR